MRTNKLYTLVFLAFLVVFNSCTKEQVEEDFNSPINNDMLVFNTVEEYNSAIEKTNSFNHDELLAWEEAQGYKSFGRLCDEFYYSMEPDSFKKIEEINEYVEKHGEFLVLQNDQFGDRYCFPMEYDDKQRYIYNMDKMYAIKDSVYRKVDEVIVYTNIKHFSILQRIKGVDEIFDNPLFKVKSVGIVNPSISKKEQYEDRSTNGRYRLKLFIQTELFHYSLPGKWETHRETEFKITNYKRTLGIWFQKKLRTDYQIDLISYDDRSQIYRQLTAIGNNVSDAVIKDSDKVKLQDGLTWDYPPYFSYYYATASNDEGCRVTFQ